MKQRPIELPSYVQAHRTFLKSWRHLPAHAQQAIYTTIIRLHENPKHPSLHVHALKRVTGIQECYVSQSLRLLYRHLGSTLYLINVGTHRCIERAHLNERSL